MSNGRYTRELGNVARRALAIAVASRAPFPGKDAARKALAALKQPLKSAAVTPPRPFALPGLGAVRDGVARLCRGPRHHGPPGALLGARRGREGRPAAAHGGGAHLDRGHMCLTASFVSVRKALSVDPRVVFRS